MLACILKVYCFFVVSVISVHSSFGATDYSYFRPIRRILTEILEGSDNNALHETRRDLGRNNIESWTGKWFPPLTTEKSLPYSEGQPSYPNAQDENSMWKMINSSCDDGKTNLTVDWAGSPINYTCFNPHQYFLPNYDVPNIIIKSLIPEAYKAKHECMKNEIHYTSDLPTFGTHRPAWPRYGEYQFVPRQRWIHSLEHGAIVMLYHPCAHPQLVSELRELVTGCLYRHIITPYTLLPHDRPLALLSWGWALLMSAPEENSVKTFIRDHAKKGPEALSKDGQFSEGLMRPASTVSGINDSVLCPSKVLF